MKASICWDSENVHPTDDLLTKLIEFVTSKKDRVISQRIYINSSQGNSAKCSLASYVQQSMKIVDVTSPLKNGVDNQIKSDLLDDIYSDNSPDAVILVSGDGDFVNCVKILRDQGKYVIIFARKGSAKKSLKDVANEFYFIDDLHQLVREKTQPQPTVINSQINYNEAVECLIATVNDALRQNRPTHYSYISQLMCKLFPKYQGVASISIPNGKKIKSFGKFVDMVVKEGKIIRQNQELFLRELDKIPA
ncbi:NYN domain-containing protein [Dolichospermum circinale]|uniref:NYN domain-containing protein n=1 Tax=Dolichospermum circinale TaxID=109265 RepID=UPI00232BF3CE|nr:NYN domain-containing protein [Dolichospermum circinale]MDB9453818.1 NYN domain-containing protein [Dolichospermum circinale CS-541/06]MDB9462398.1 NYN domain-containing protein [Dolichospermum circinale CS-541/04]MDB9548572.1 NYN domain-containing protein [Dolichospermum circinale CS-1031]